MKEVEAASDTAQRLLVDGGEVHLAKKELRARPGRSSRGLGRRVITSKSGWASEQAQNQSVN